MAGDGICGMTADDGHVLLWTEGNQAELKVKVFSIFPSLFTDVHSPISYT